jgi:hypothetical protein
MGAPPIAAVQPQVHRHFFMNFQAHRLAHFFSVLWTAAALAALLEIISCGLSMCQAGYRDSFGTS